MAFLPSCSITAVRRLARSATRSRCHDSGGGPATFQTWESAAPNAPAMNRRERKKRRFINVSRSVFSLYAFIMAGHGILHLGRNGKGSLEPYYRAQDH